jgi:cytochrome bd-type quinol oxidase subunit 1
MLIDNTALLLILSIVYEISYYFPQRMRKYTSVFSGFLIGIIGFVIMSTPYILSAMAWCSTPAPSCFPPRG